MDIEAKHPHSRYSESDTTSAADSSPTRRTILIVDHDVSSRDLLARILLESGFQCLEASDVSTAILALACRPPEAIVLDSALPGTSGLQYLRMLKQDRRTRDIPIIMTRDTATEQDCITALDLGADDFIVKPFSARECIARLQAVLRRCARQARLNGRDAPDGDETAVVEYGGLRLDPLTHRVSAGRDRYVRLGSTEFRLLRFFLRHPERIHNRNELLEEMRGPNPALDSRTVDAYIRRVRQALKPHGCDIFLRTVHGMGYQFSAPSVGDRQRRG
jgi:two-component system, OmpR family, phosphate regulon response regulator PhoB